MSPSLFPIYVSLEIIILYALSLFVSRGTHIFAIFSDIYQINGN